MKTVALGEVVDFYSGGTPSKSNPDFWHGTVPWFSAKDMKRDRLTDSADHLSDKVFAATPLRRLQAGTVAIVVRGMILAHTIPICILDVDASINQDLKALIPRREIDPSFLAAMLRAQHDKLLAQVTTAAHGTKKLDSRVLQNLEIPLPPLSEQRRIAAILGHADALRAKRRQVLAHVDALTQSVFVDMFGNPRSWHDRWPMGTIDDLASAVAYGTSAKAGTHGRWPVLRMGNITDDGRLDLSDLKYLDLSTGEIEKFTVRRGDLLFNRTNSREKVGKSAVVRNETPMAYAGYLIRVRFEDAATAEFVSAYLNGAHGREVRKKMAKVAVNQANINASEMRNISIPLPPPQIRARFGEHLKVILARRDVLLHAVDMDTELFASLQHRAFRGEL